MRALLMIVLSSFVIASTALAAEPEWRRNGGPRIRPQDARTTAMMAAGIARSASFRALVARDIRRQIVTPVSVPVMLCQASGPPNLGWLA